MSTPLTDATALLAKLVSFDTTSAKTNLPCAEFIRDYLAGLTDASAYHGVTGTIRFHADGDPVGKGIVMTRVHRGALQVEAGQ